MSIESDTKKVFRAAERQGWTSKAIKAGTMWFSPDGVSKVTVHRTPSDHRTFDNMLQQFRAGGLQWPEQR